MVSNRLFVSVKDTFTLSVFFTKEGEMRVASLGDIKDSELDQWEKFDFEFLLPDYGTAKTIMRNSVDYDHGSPVLNVGSFHNALLVTLGKGWNLKDENAKDIPFDIQKLNELRPDIVRILLNLLQEKLTKEGLYDSLLAS